MLSLRLAIFRMISTIRDTRTIPNDRQPFIVAKFRQDATAVLPIFQSSSSALYRFLRFILRAMKTRPQIRVAYEDVPVSWNRPGLLKTPWVITLKRSQSLRERESSRTVLEVLDDSQQSRNDCRRLFECLEWLHRKDGRRRFWTKIKLAASTATANRPRLLLARLRP